MLTVIDHKASQKLCDYLVYNIMTTRQMLVISNSHYSSQDSLRKASGPPYGQEAYY